MEFDSMHSIIERHLKNREIHVPAVYVDICKNAIKNRRQYFLKLHKTIIIQMCMSWIKER